MTSGLWLVGGGGHCKACLDVLTLEGRHTVSGIIDRPEKAGTAILGYAVSATDEDMARLAGEGASFMITVGQTGLSPVRMRIAAHLEKIGARMATSVSPLARVATGVEVGAGTIVMHYALVNADARIGRNCIVNSRALVEHDARIGDHCHISTGAIVNGGAEVGEGCFIGSGAVLLQGIRIAPGVLIGAGCVVIADILEPGTYVGNPARKAGR